MSKRGLLFSVLGLFVFSLIGTTIASGADEPEYVPGRLLVGQRAGIRPDMVERVLRAHRAVTRRQMPRIGMSVIDVPEASAAAVMASLQQSGAFDYVERDYYAHPAAVPNDPSFPSQWHLPKIQAPQAWNVTTGSSSVVVAVVDSGVDGTHSDLAPRLVQGWNFLNSTTNTTDVLGHGTAVSGTIAAAANNGVGISGVTWGSRIMPLVVVDANASASYSNMAAAIQYAVDHGVRVINLSLGGSSASSTLQNAVDYAWSKGAVVFAAAMNNSTSTPYYPAACNHVVSVSATDNNDALASFSDYGTWVTISAPGTNILTTSMGGAYGYWAGTSFSSPIAAGVAALVLAANPLLTNTALVSLLEQTADDLGAPGYDTSFGFGRINAYRAVVAARQAAVLVTVSMAPTATTLNPGQTQQFTAAVTGLSNTAVTWSLNPAVGTISGGLYTAPATVPAGQTVNVTATTTTGSTATAVITLTATPPPPAPPATTTTTGFTPIRVNTGGPAYIDALGRTWAADSGSDSGYSWAVNGSIGNTASPALYQTCHYGPAFTYRFAVPNGTYTVNLKFAEVSRTAPGQRVFNVGVNGTLALTKFDIFAQAGGAMLAVDRAIPVTVSGGQIAVQFTTGNDWPMVNAIEIVAATSASAAPPSAGSPIRVNAGGGSATDPQGRLWSADTGSTGGYSWSANNAIANTNTPALYQSCRYGPSFNYQFPVPNGNYTVNLKFAEVSRTAPGQRAFNVAVNGAPVLSNFDIFAQAGGEFIALDRTFPVTVSGGRIVVQFSAGTDWPLVSAIEVIPN